LEIGGKMDLDFSRPELMNAEQVGGYFHETEVKWINPREFHRKAISDIENFGFRIPRNVNENLKVEQENIGGKTGYVKSWIKGTKSIDGQGTIRYSPFGGLGIALLIIGIFFLLFIETSIELFGLGIIFIAVGIGLMMYRTSGKFKVFFVPQIKIHSEGEATERTVKREGADVTDLFAQLMVSFAGLSEICIEQKGISKALNQKINRTIPNAFRPTPYKQSETGNFLNQYSINQFEDENKRLSDIFEDLKTRISKYGTDIEEKSRD